MEPETPSPPTVRLRAILKHPYTRLVVLSSILLLGVVLAYVSSTPEVVLLGEQTLEDSAAEGTSIVPLDLPPATITQASLSNGPCGVSFHFLKSDELLRFNETGVLPSGNLDCERRDSTLSGHISYLAIRNERDAPAEYRLEFALYSVRSPNAIYALPAFVLVMVGSLGIVLTILRKALSKLLLEDKRK